MYKFLGRRVRKFFLGEQPPPAIIDTRSHVPELKMLLDKYSRMTDGGTVVTFKGPTGTAALRGLVKRPEVAVLDCVMLKGTTFPEHRHELEREWLMVYEGQLGVTMNGVTKIIKTGGVIEISPNDSHNSIALTDVRVIAVTMPADEGFPDGHTRPDN